MALGNNNNNNNNNNNVGSIFSFLINNLFLENYEMTELVITQHSCSI